MHKSILFGHHSVLSQFNVAKPKAFFSPTLFEVDILHLFRCISTRKRDGAWILAVTSVKKTFKGFKMISIIPYTLTLIFVTSLHWDLSCLILSTAALVRNRDSHSRQYYQFGIMKRYSPWAIESTKGFQLRQGLQGFGELHRIPPSLT